jgi:hypothetical protein
VVSKTIPIVLKKIFFGDLHWHTIFSEGDYDIDQMYENAISDNYLDFTGCTDHANMNYPRENPWDIIKEKTNTYYNPGIFSTLLGYEWSSSDIFPGGYKISPNGCEDVSHINFYYRDCYSNADFYSMYEKLNYDDIFEAMAVESNLGHRNIGYVHHTQGKLYLFSSSLVRNPILIRIPFFQRFSYDFTTNFSFLANQMKNSESRDKILRGVEVYSRWGTSIGPYSNLAVTWPYYQDDPLLGVVCANKTDAWVENGMWEWSQNELKNTKFVMQMGGETHHIDRPGSAFLWRDKPAGLMAIYSTHNTREEIWDAMNNCTVYGSQLLKIRANVRFDDQMALGRWINCSSPLTINISAMATFPGLDNNGKTMSPHLYPSDELTHNISDIWVIKKDREQGRPWCRIIKHVQPNQHISVVSFKDYDVQPNDFYYIVIRQNGAELTPGQNQYSAFLGPVFIDNVKN